METIARTLEAMAGQAIFQIMLVFMLHGLCKKWKHPLAYYLSHGSAKGEMFVSLMEVLDSCYNAGL